MNDQPKDRETLAYRVNVWISAKIYDWIEAYERRRGRTMADFIRDALELDRWADAEAEQEGQR
jgi:hypothetical protein